ncbi:zinc finger CCCH-type antiviral protein 1 [Sinocyclocheilus grahami]|uniref:zinc finger CCCH-type antiviral protein 1 n=1 Tax=Sinocyclocheilus grahami TaxID=75366 RepID=UPI0007AD537C|nr:PREDICTED: zinc finger CCCH-type antiviral protein 1-like [Sinocyclocheilus grahami]
MNMASNYQEDSDEGSNQQSSESCAEFNDSDTDSEAASDSGSESEEDAQTSSKRNVCMNYNRGHCRYGDKCRNEHICNDFLKDSCEFGAGCRLNHNVQSSSSRQGRKKRSRPSFAETDEEFDGPYKWQLNIGKGWKNISNDHILEAQYSLPNIKGIKIYNTQAGVISIDFTKMRVLQKTNIKVRRMSAKDTEWLWYYRGDHCWYQYGEKFNQNMFSPSTNKTPEWQFKGKDQWYTYNNTRGCSVSNADIERCYQQNQTTMNFTVSRDSYTLDFAKMSQVNQKTKTERKVRRV